MEKFINLEKSQKNEVIGMIGAESFLNHFNSCKAGFAKLSSGISIQKLNSENVLDIAIAKSDEKLISDFADSFIEKSIKPIEKAVDDKKAYFEEEASLIAVCLLGTVYEGHEKLFFRLIKKPYNKTIPERIKLIRESFVKPIGSMGFDKSDLLLYDDSDISIELYDEHECTSLCKVSEMNSQNQIWLTRLADIDRDGNLCRFEKGDYRFYSEKWERLYRKNGPEEQGIIGIWNWHVAAREIYDDAFESRADYVSNVSPIEIIKVEDASSEYDLINALRTGIKSDRNSGRMLFAFENVGNYTGVICSLQELDFCDGSYKLKEKVKRLPLYKFDYRQMIELDSREFYYRLTIGIPAAIVAVKSNTEIVKSLVLESISWSQFKQRGVIKNDWQKFKNYIEAINTDTLIDAVSQECECEKKEAEDLINAFTGKAAEFLDEKSYEDTIFNDIIFSSNSMTEQAKKLVEEEWKNDQREKIEKISEKIRKLQDDYDNIKSNIELENDKYKKLVESCNSISLSIAEKEQLAQDVENGVAERIGKARQNAADFIAEMAFVGSGSSSLQIAQTVSSFFEEGKENKNGDPDENSKWEDVLDTISEEFKEAGVKQAYSYQLAAYIYSAYILRIPLLLAGPNADDIINAFSMSLCAKKAGSLFLDGEYSPAVINEALSGNDAVVCIHNPFENAWISKLPEIMNNNYKYFMISYPYVEDVRIEPKSLYNYVLPLFTEFFIEKPSTGNFSGGIQKEDFLSYKVTEAEKEQFPALCDAIGIIAIARYRIQEMLSAMFGMLGKEDTESALVFLFANYAYATMQTGKLAEWLNDNADELGLSESVKEKILVMLGECNE